MTNVSAVCFVFSVFSMGILYGHEQSRPVEPRQCQSVLPKDPVTSPSCTMAVLLGILLFGKRDRRPAWFYSKEAFDV
jgi:hypothetical protein